MFVHVYKCVCVCIFDVLGKCRCYAVMHMQVCVCVCVPAVSWTKQQRTHRRCVFIPPDSTTLYDIKGSANDCIHINVLVLFGPG